MYEYRATLVEDSDAHDGDTVRLDADLGFGVQKWAEPFRLYGINAPELRGETYGPAVAARDRLVELIRQNETDGKITIRTRKDKREKFGRYLVEIFTADGKDTINAILVREGHAVEYLP